MTYPDGPGPYPQPGRAPGAATSTAVKGAARQHTGTPRVAARSRRHDRGGIIGSSHQPRRLDNSRHLGNHGSGWCSKHLNTSTLQGHQNSAPNTPSSPLRDPNR